MSRDAIWFLRPGHTFTTSIPIGRAFGTFCVSILQIEIPTSAELSPCSAGILVSRQHYYEPRQFNITRLTI